MISGVHTSFDIGVAEELGCPLLAIMVHYFQRWIRLNKKKKINFREGRTWMYQTLEDIKAEFSYFSVKQIRTLINKLVKMKILMKGNFNRTAYDRTLWYAFVDEQMFSICPNGQNERPTKSDVVAETGSSITEQLFKQIEEEKEDPPLTPPSEMVEEDLSLKRTKQKKESARKLAFEEKIAQWKKEGRPSSAIDAVIETYHAQPKGSILSIKSWMEAVYKQKEELDETEKVFRKRRKFAEKIAQQNPHNYHFSESKDSLAYISGAVESVYDIKGTRKESKDFWEAYSYEIALIE